MNVGCVILASGKSRRFDGGQNKLLADLDKRPLILHTAESCRTAGLSPVIVTRSEEVQALMLRNGYDCVMHSDPEKSATIRHGLSYVLRNHRRKDREDRQTSSAGQHSETGMPIIGCIFMPGDQPLIHPKSLHRMTEEFFSLPVRDKVVRLSRNGIGASPVLFPANMFPALLTLTGEESGRTLLKKAGEVLLVEAESETELWDVDTMEDLKKIQSMIDYIKLMGISATF